MMTQDELLELIEKAEREEWTELDLSGQGLEELPEEIGRLRSLEELRLYNNKLETLPDSIANLTNLRTLGLSENEFRELPEVGQTVEEIKVIVGAVASE